jgi:hypothetical protein
VTRVYSDRALRSFFGGRIGGQDRPQEINTPQFLIDAILELWPNGIELDPCTNVWSSVPARNKIIAKEIDSSIYLINSPKYPISKNGGLFIDWPDYTYANPPYRDLKPWLLKPVPTMEHLLLCPVRTNRTWFCEAVGTASLICWLKPFAFDGHIQTFPAPLALVYYGCRTQQFGEIFCRYGTIGRMIVRRCYQPTEKSATQEVLDFG